MPGRAINDAVNGPQQGAPRLVVKHDDNAGARQVVRVHLGFTANRAAEEEKDKISDIEFEEDYMRFNCSVLLSLTSY